ncbi:MAG: hypothetical protein BRC47_11265 [Cyanobacteria bacterium QS_7_48_42]|jgi:magnesium-transporting ATPase (P-type)|nr:MAG: hypothetical protein BRC36_12760 [Cyanobacteria bacterium QH_2_48_84]PSO83187.1 MAG: hypothetical protein BRC45_08240 [Cyanobacteria bacterium QS_5_48_63]PSO85124.1 MAG: hypothetical protein BRC41_09160 [Cyanobacteria bacterium QH_9_48_43]PSO87919.1 MAG: hypothetical protein BRC43_08065 [Cyanobacteria bacterium QS_3_48_167]PSO91020.1 MAG: hypothetical protein BRC46_12135 [Cyanobacteria bacterium QS_6_48_18]PSO94451.1 MAG: hypothetical protein BRC48_10560 [Cyanobacteria bacterium QS_9_4
MFQKFKPPQQDNPVQIWASLRIRWWIAITFIVGSAFFTLGASAALFPQFFAQDKTALILTDSFYFLGAILFTIGIYMQILEAINVNRKEFRWWAWQPQRISFLSPLVLLVGSLLFNVETTFALVEGLDWFKKNLLVSLPSLVGAVCFVISCYMDFARVSQKPWAWKPRYKEWWVHLLNLFGSIGFLVGASFGFEFPGLSVPEDALVVKAFYLQGSIFFLIASYLMLPVIFSEEEVRLEGG